MRKILPTLLLFCLIIMFNYNTFGQNETKNKEIKLDQEQTFKVDTTLINIPTIVIDKKGQYIKDLKQEDFVIYENGKKQEIELFSAETVPLNVVLLMDMSTSNRRNGQVIKQAARAFIENIRPEDKLKMVSFTYNIKELNEFTSSKEILKETTDKLNTSGSTRLYDAVEYSARVIFDKVEGRKALIILTDGIDSASYFSPQLAISKIVETDAVVYVVKYPTTIYPANPSYLLLTQDTKPQKNQFNFVSYNKEQDFLKELVEQTGGDLLVAPSFNLLTEKMKNVAEQLRHTYSLGYYPTNPIENGGYRKIEVKLHERKATLRYKKGYQPQIKKM